MIPWPWPAPVDDGAAAHLEPGMPMPDIPLPITSGQSVSLASMSGRAIVYVYPWTGQPGVADPPGWGDIPGAHGSTAQAQGFKNLHSSFASLDTAVFGLSSQDTAWQGELVQRLGLPFGILSDEDFQMARALRLPTFIAGGKTYYKRISLLIRDGRIELPFYPVHPPDVHARDVLACLTDLVGYELESRING